LLWKNGCILRLEIGLITGTGFIVVVDPDLITVILPLSLLKFNKQPELELELESVVITLGLRFGARCSNPEIRSENRRSISRQFYP
jgi:hypothetical protein